MLKSIKSAFALRIFFFFIVLCFSTILVAYFIVRSLRTDIAEEYSRMYARTAEREISTRLNQYITATISLAQFPAMKTWFLDEFNARKKNDAHKTMQIMRTHLKNRPGIFSASVASQRYYFNNKYVVTMKRGSSDDAWFFKLLKERPHQVVEMDYDTTAKKMRFWISVPVTFGQRILGVVGIGMDITVFIKTMLEIGQAGSYIVMFDKSGMLKGAKDSSLINKKYVFDMIKSVEGRILLRARMQQMENEKGAQRVLKFSVVQDGNEYIACLTYIKAVKWYALVMVNASSIITLVRFLPILFVLIAAFCVFLLYILLLSSRLVLRPLLALADVMKQTGKGDFSAKADITARYEFSQIAAKFNSMLDELQKQQQDLIVKERMEKEFEIVRQMQSSILPEIPELDAYNISARMIPADEVGGDYYDFYNLPNGRVWFGIGDVTGHGIVSGIIMLMAQTTVNAIIKMCPDITPAELAVFVNRALYENIRNRLGSHSFMTFYFLVSDDQGNFSYAGCHSDILIYRRDQKRCIRMQPDGTWLGVFPDISREIVEKEFTLHKDDLLVLYTDGIIEAANEHDEQFSVERLMQVVEQNASLPVDDLRSIILDSVIGHMEEQKDDITLYIIRKQ